MNRKRTGVPSTSTPKATQLLQTYLLSLCLQLGDRRCVGCGEPVDNTNLGGHARKSALSGLLWCLRCADGLERRRT
jgi:hypothetical protein